MARNIIDAICEIVQSPKHKIKAYAQANNRANAEGDALEDYIKDVFAGAINSGNAAIRDEKLADCFSYIGNQKNPPDMMLRGGDAIEVKKITKMTSSLPLNSSYPKAKLYSNSRMISRACKECEVWDEKDMIYAVGVVKGGVLSALMFVYGVDYCADKETYERVYNAIKKGVKVIKGVDFGETKELGRVNRIDPLGITCLRMRGMWHIINPFKVFGGYYQLENKADFNFIAIINEKKYYSFDNIDTLEALKKNYPTLKITDIKVKNPNNLAQLERAKMITYSYADVN